MRAIIECKCLTEITDDQLKEVLCKNDWWPILSQEDELVKSHYEEIWEHVAEQDKEWVGRTHKFTIYDELSKSWGIVNRPSSFCITFRIKNPNSDKLKQCCQKLISDLVREYEGSVTPQQPEMNKYFSIIAPDLLGGQKNTRKRLFNFPSRIEVLEPNSSLHAFSGDVKVGNKFNILFKMRKADCLVVFIAALISVALVFLTSPGIQQNLVNAYKLDPSAVDWVEGFFERLATTAIFTTFVTSLNLYLLYLDLSRKAYVDWTI